MKKSVALSRTIIFILAMVLFILPGCGYKALEDRIRDKLNNNNNESGNTALPTGSDGEFDQYGGIDWSQVQYDEDGLPYVLLNSNGTRFVVSVIDLQTLKEISPGQEVIIDDKNISHLSYLVTGKRIWNSLSDADISEDELSGAQKVKLPESDNLPQNIKLLTVDLEITNLLDTAYEGNISTIRLTEKRILNLNDDDMLAYFSPAGKDTEYFHFRLEPGQKSVFRIAWLVDTTKFHINSLILLFGNSHSGYQYVPLDKNP